MKKIIINGGRILSGRVEVSGSKNAALPLILAALTVRGESSISGVPKIGDTEVAIELLRELGATVWWHGDTLKIDTEGAKYRVPSSDLVAKIRASTYLLGASLVRFGEARILKYGGCDFSGRPIDLHIKAACALGARFTGDRLIADCLSGGEINFPKASVGATVNALIMAASAKGESVIRGFAREPHILTLIDFLISAGADIRVSDDEIRVTGARLSSGSGRVGPDMIEAGSYIVTAATSGGDVIVDGAPTSELMPFLSVIESLGVDFSVKGDSVRVAGINRPGWASAVAAPYPAFPTDLQPIIAPLMALSGGGEIIDTVWRERFGYLDTLSHLGVRSEKFFSGAKIYPSLVRAAEVIAPDLRGGMAAVMTALSAKGKSVIYSADTVLRGYERLEEKLRSIGADVEVLSC